VGYKLKRKTEIVLTADITCRHVANNIFAFSISSPSMSPIVSLLFSTARASQHHFCWKHSLDKQTLQCETEEQVSELRQQIERMISGSSVDMLKVGAIVRSRFALTWRITFAQEGDAGRYRGQQ
jgi:hypothetical protein